MRKRQKLQLKKLLPYLIAFPRIENLKIPEIKNNRYPKAVKINHYKSRLIKSNSNGLGKRNKKMKRT